MAYDLQLTFGLRGGDAIRAGVAPAPYQGIVEAAERKKCDAIFIASHGRRGLARLMLGSVTHKVLTHSKVPVLVFR